MTRQQWKARIDSLPKGLTYQEVADRIGYSYFQTRAMMKRLGRKPPRAGKGKLWPKSALFWKRVDWTMRDVDIARKMSKTRERVRQVRQMLGMPKVSKQRSRPKITLDKVG